MEPKAWQLELFRPRYNVEPGQHAGRLLDMLCADATSVVFVVEDLQPAMLKAADHHKTYIVTIVSCQWGVDGEAAVSATTIGGRPERRSPLRARYACGTCGRVRLSSDVSEIKLVFIAPRRLGAPDDLCRADDAKDLDETSHLVEQVPLSKIFAPFGQDDHRYKAWGDFFNPAGVFQDVICCGHRMTHPSKLRRCRVPR